MERSRSWEAISHLASQEIPRRLCNPKVPATGPYPEVDAFSPHLSTLFPQDPF